MAKRAESVAKSSIGSKIIMMEMLSKVNTAEMEAKQKQKLSETKLIQTKF